MIGALFLFCLALFWSWGVLENGFWRLWWERETRDNFCNIGNDLFDRKFNRMERITSLQH